MIYNFIKLIFFEYELLNCKKEVTIMGKQSVNSNDIIFALDIGTRSVIGTVGIVRDKKFNVIAESYREHTQRAMLDGQIHDISKVSETVIIVKNELELKLGFKLKKVSIAAAGRFLRTVIGKSALLVESEKEIDKDIIRSLELTAVKKAESQVQEETEGRLYCVGYSIKNYYLNGFLMNNLLSHKGEKIEVEVIATFLPRSVVDSLYSVMEKVELDVICLTLEPIAAMEAAVPTNLRILNIALVDIGAGTSDIAISSNNTISAYGMVPLAGDELTELIAQNYLVDFNTAEALKKKCSTEQELHYTDVLGIENTINSEDIVKSITSLVYKISNEIGSKIIELNENKSPKAVFLVGGGAHTPKIKEALSQKLNLPIQRIGIKDRTAVVDCECISNELGTIGVTVLGIAIVSIKKLGHNFIDVILNNDVVSLFNSNKHTLMDILIQAGISPKVLLSKNGNSIRFSLNGIKRIAFGALAVGASIKINGEIASIDSEIKEADKIILEYARDGENATPQVIDYIGEINSLDFYINDASKKIEPIVTINGDKANALAQIYDGDNVEIKKCKTLLEYRNFFTPNIEKYIYLINGKEISESYVIKQGDRIYSTLEEIETNKVALSKKSSESIDIKINVNDEIVLLTGKESYIFVDIFDFVQFERNVVKGKLILLLNNKSAGYYDALKDNDQVIMKWDDI